MRLFILTIFFVFSIAAGKAVQIKRNLGGQSRIIGGQPAYTSAFPFAAAINVQTADSKFFCGGSLYRNQWIITAGQCVDGAILFTIKLGSISLKEEDPNRVTVATSDYILHPDYNSRTLENDIAIIKLRLSIEYTDFIKQVSLPTSEIKDVASLRALGWGQTSDSDSELASELNYAFVTSLSNAECRLTYGNQITDKMVCIEGNYNEGICHGDTDTPLLGTTSNKYESLQVGVASFMSGNGCESTDPSGYTRLYPYVDWIRNATET